MTVLGLACCCTDEATFRGRTIMHANEDVMKAGWSWHAQDGHCTVRCPSCRIHPDKWDRSAMTIMEWQGAQVEVKVVLAESA